MLAQRLPTFDGTVASPGLPRQGLTLNHRWCWSVWFREWGPAQKMYSGYPLVIARTYWSLLLADSLLGTDYRHRCISQQCSRARLWFCFLYSEGVGNQIHRCFRCVDVRMLVWCCCNVCDVGPTSNQHRLSQCLLLVVAPFSLPFSQLQYYRN